LKQWNFLFWYFRNSGILYISFKEKAFMKQKKQSAGKAKVKDGIKLKWFDFKNWNIDNDDSPTGGLYNSPLPWKKAWDNIPQFRKAVVTVFNKGLKFGMEWVGSMRNGGRERDEAEIKKLKKKIARLEARKVK
jgi:hypothetical protein